jgi:hypothetical protein
MSADRHHDDVPSLLPAVLAEFRRVGVTVPPIPTGEPPLDHDEHECIWIWGEGDLCFSLIVTTLDTTVDLVWTAELRYYINYQDEWPEALLHREDGPSSVIIWSDMSEVSYAWSLWGVPAREADLVQLRECSGQDRRIIEDLARDNLVTFGTWSTVFGAVVWLVPGTA